MTRAEGRLRHMFYGTYSAMIGLAFDSEAHAKDALAALGPEWKINNKAPKCLYMIADSAVLDKVKKQFTFTIKACGRPDCRHQCINASIDSVSHSIDFGPVFYLDIPTIPLEQASLF